MLAYHKPLEVLTQPLNHDPTIQFGKGGTAGTPDIPISPVKISPCLGDSVVSAISVKRYFPHPSISWVLGGLALIAA
jgi:hypothetical protein